MDKPDILGMNESELSSLMTLSGEKAFRAKQLYGWMMKGYDIDEMKNLPEALRDKIKKDWDYRMPVIQKKLVSAKDGTIKYLFRLVDGEFIESVFMRYEHGNTLCVSCQAGCRMGCRFCASTIDGLARNLTSSEILGQIIAAQRDTGERVDGVVMMGIGEPLDNYAGTVGFLKLVSEPKGLNIGLRHISVSTCGLADRIYNLADEGLPVTLSISLHSPTDERRREIMPVANKYPLSLLIDACRYYFDKTGRRISFEYTLIAGQNDSRSDAEKLAYLLKKKFCRPSHVNIILLNEVKETQLLSVSRKSALVFVEMLNEYGVNATVRRRLGSDINASCGQLRRKRNAGNLV